MEATTKTKFTSVSEYIATFPDVVQTKLEALRIAIKQAAPQAEEVISYNMPAFRQNGVLVYFAAYKMHIGFYPTAAPMQLFKDELRDYKTSKGAIHFPHAKAIPITLVKKIVAYRVKENVTKAKAKKIN